MRDIIFVLTVILVCLAWSAMVDRNHTQQATIATLRETVEIQTAQAAWLYDDLERQREELSRWRNPSWCPRCNGHLTHEHREPAAD